MAVAITASRSRWAPTVTGLGTLILCLLVMEALVRSRMVDPFVVPPPSQIALSFERIIVEEHVLSRFLVTAGETLVATALIAVIGVPLGILLHRAEILRRVTESWIAACAAAPIILAYPLFLVIFGRNSLAIVMLAVAGGLAPVILKTLEGLASTRRVLIDVGRSYSLSPWTLFRKILLPSAAPTIFVGLRLGVLFSLIKIVGVEFLINFGGLGQLINELAERYDLPGTYAAICFVILVSVLVFVIMEQAERWLRQPR